MGLGLKERNFKDSIDRCLEDVRLEPAYRQRILEQCTPEYSCSTKPRFSTQKIFRKVCFVAATCAIILTSGIGVVAASPSLQQTLNQLSQEFLVLLSPVEGTSTSEGIRMEVLAAMRDNDVLMVYLTLQDIQKQNRLDGQLELVDFSAESKKDGNQQCLFSHGEVLWYDSASQKATLRLVGQAFGGLDDQKISLNIHSFLSGKNELPLINCGVTLAEIAQQAPSAQWVALSEVDGYGSSGEDMERLSQQVENGTMPLLQSGGFVPSVFQQFSWMNVEGVAITTGNTLHGKISYDDQMGRFNRLALYLSDTQGNVLDTSQISLELESYETDNHHRYTKTQEQVLVLPSELPLEEISLSAQVTTYEHHIEGNWQTNFSVEDASLQTTTTPANVKLGGWNVETITISPVGITLQGHGDSSQDFHGPQVDILLKNGSYVQSNSSSCSVQDNEFFCKNLFALPIEMEEIDKILVNGTEVPVL